MGTRQLLQDRLEHAATYRVHFPYVGGSPAHEEALTAGAEAEALLADFVEEAPALEHAEIARYLPSDHLLAVARELRELYDAGVKELDRELGAFVAELRGRRFLDSGYLLFTSDHGESFLEHGGLQHVLPPHEEQVRVPLVLLGPGVPTARSDSSVSLLDVTPTLAALAGLERDASWSGRSLLLLTCPRVAAGSASSTALITDGKVVRRILEHLGLPTNAPALAPARSPPGLEFDG